VRATYRACCFIVQFFTNENLMRSNRKSGATSLFLSVHDFSSVQDFLSVQEIETQPFGDP
jgi:hypothetical protein